MIKHIVLFKFKVSDDKAIRLQAIKTALEQLNGKISELKGIQVGINTNPIEKWDLSLEVLVENLNTLALYANHPEHQAILKNLIKPILEDRACVDYQY